MKLLILIILILSTSCGKSTSSSGGSNSSSVEENTDGQDVNADRPQKLACLERHLGWLKDPPANTSDAFKRLENLNFAECKAGHYDIAAYTQQVVDKNPDLNQ